MGSDYWGVNQMLNITRVHYMHHLTNISYCGWTSQHMAHFNDSYVRDLAPPYGVNCKECLLVLETEATREEQVPMWDEDELWSDPIDKRDIVNGQERKIRYLESEVRRLQDKLYRMEKRHGPVGNNNLIRQVTGLQRDVARLKERNEELYRDRESIRKWSRDQNNLGKHWTIAVGVSRGIHALAMWAANCNRPTVRRFVMLDL